MKLTLFIVTILFFLINSFSLSDLNKKSDYLVWPESSIYLTAGHRMQIADLLWIRSLQDFDYCSQKINSNECVGQSWLFKILNLATMMDPFLEPVMYQSAGLALTILISDYAGASIILDKAVRIYPRNWQINYLAGYHALYEEKNKKKAAQLYEAAADHGAPSWVKYMSGRLAADAGETEYAEQILSEMISINKNPEYAEMLRKKIEQHKKKN